MTKADPREKQSANLAGATTMTGKKMVKASSRKAAPAPSRARKWATAFGEGTSALPAAAAPPAAADAAAAALPRAEEARARAEAAPSSTEESRRSEAEGPAAAEGGWREGS